MLKQTKQQLQLPVHSNNPPRREVLYVPREKAFLLHDEEVCLVVAPVRFGAVHRGNLAGEVWSGAKRESRMGVLLYFFISPFVPRDSPGSCLTGRDVESDGAQARMAVSAKLLALRRGSEPLSPWHLWSPH